MEGNNLYVYCISYYRPDLERDTVTGHDNQPVFFIPYHELAACVSTTSLTSMEAGYERLKCHEDMISGLMEKTDILPMRFSTICKSRESVTEMLRKYYDQFVSNLAYISGRIELGIKVFYKLDFEKEDKKDKELLKVPREYMMKRYERYCERQSKIEESLSAIEKYHRGLKDIAVDSCYTKPLKNNLIFNASYLVEGEKKDSFDLAVEKMKEDNSAYKILYSGPWPAYHFVNIVKEGEEDG